MGVFNVQTAEAANMLFKILTNSGSLVVTSQNNTFTINGSNGITTAVKNNMIVLSNTHIHGSGILGKIFYQGSSGNLYLSDQASLSSLSAIDVRSSQPYSGVVTSFEIVPLNNGMMSPTTITLFVNNVNTTKSLVVPPQQYSLSTVQLNYSFLQGDNIYWVVTSHDNTADSFTANMRVLIQYN